GDTIRVSLTEDPWYEVPVARELADRAQRLWDRFESTLRPDIIEKDDIDPIHYHRRETVEVSLGENCPINADNPPRVVIPVSRKLSEYQAVAREILDTHAKQKEVRAEGILLKLDSPQDISGLHSLSKILSLSIKSFFVEPADFLRPADLAELRWNPESRLVVVRRFAAADSPALAEWLAFCEKHNALLAIDTDASSLESFLPILKSVSSSRLIFTLSRPSGDYHALGSYRALSSTLNRNGIKSPIWIRNTVENATHLDGSFQGRLIEASMLSGALFCDGLGDIISIETESNFSKALVLAYNVLQGSRMRISKTEYVACPSCGRTLFDIQSTTLKIKERTGHLKGVTIAVMGCIVNGPGEMADADFGYVGGAPGKINLYVRKDCVKFNIPQTEAVDRLIDLIREHGKWVEPDVVAAPV
ncbi:MAG: flavodoxin-dependent (E)-4-hydroxy-3-methylbut-2-enyl-diphosphate synthase, partial [Puniceicoccales bacterium]|nr:flavodoxin-dependent (E)-4-hydroxy-3-methylbut-2-enyl-diphosphate synthase [Puniceicoccales bacterium]